MKLKILLTAYVLAVITMSFFQQDDNLKTSMERGKVLFKTCTGCHGKEGQGSKLSPPLAQSDFLRNNEASKIIQIVKYGLEGEIVVNGKTYNGKMPAIPFDNQQIADVLNFVRNSFGNKGSFIFERTVEITVRK